jgi:hypothetical protein
MSEWGLSLSHPQNALAMYLRDDVIEVVKVRDFLCEKKMQKDIREEGIMILHSQTSMDSACYSFQPNHFEGERVRRGK